MQRPDVLNVAFSQVLATHFAAGQATLPTHAETLPITQSLARSVAAAV